MERKKLDEILKLHGLWRQGKEKGHRADLSGANLNRANLSRANLNRANLSGANNIFPIYGDKHIWYVVRWEDGIRINAGCHWFTIKEAHKYWEGKEKHGVICRASINAALAMAKARGWVK